MDRSDADRVFAGSMPQLYERYLVPLLFAPYAADLARRVAQFRPARVLELAAGTGVLTRHLAQALPPGTEIVATDLNRPMLDYAAAVGAPQPVRWQQADALALPFPAGHFDVVVCQCGVMFFPDKPRAYAEARRMLRADGHALFNVWDRIEHNEFAACVT
jgi:ubiquinone/menaquinone biosynthesis C-methylase UbiE